MDWTWNRVVTIKQNIDKVTFFIKKLFNIKNSKSSLFENVMYYTILQYTYIYNHAGHFTPIR